MSDITIRQARADELDEVGRLTLAAYRGAGYFEDGAETDYAAQLANAADRAVHGEVLVAVRADGEIVGSLTVVAPGSRYSEVSRPGELEFRMLAVAPTAQGQGVGEALTRAVLERAVELGLARVVLCTMRSMAGPQRLYQRIGFVREPARDWRPHPAVDLIAFRLDLP